MSRSNSIWLGLSYIVFTILSFATLKLNIQSFGSHIFGVWILISSVWGFGGALDFGVNFSVIKFISDFKVNRKEELNSLISTCFIILLILCTLIYVVIYNLGVFLYFNNSNIVYSNSDYILLKKVYFIVSIIFIIKYFIGFFKSIIEGFDNYIFTSKLDMMQNVGFFFISFCVWIFSFDLFVYVVLSLILYALALSTYLFYVKSRYKLRIKVSFFDKKLSIVFLKYSLSIQFVNIFAALIDPSIKYIIGSFYKVEFVSYYEIARRMALAVSGLFNTSNKNVINKVSQLVEKTDKENFVNKDCVALSKKGVVYSCLFYGATSIIVFFIVKYVFKYSEIFTIYTILCQCEMINIYFFSIYMFFAGSGKAFFLSKIQFFNLITTTTLLYIGIVMLKSELAFYGLFISLLFLNLYTFHFASKSFNFSKIIFLKRTNSYRIIVVMLLFFLMNFITPKYLIAFLTSTTSLLFIINYKEVVLICSFIKSKVTIKNA